MPREHTKCPVVPPGSDTSIATRRTHESIGRTERITRGPPKGNKVRLPTHYDAAPSQVTQGDSQSRQGSAGYGRRDASPDRVLMLRSLQGVLSACATMD